MMRRLSFLLFTVLGACLAIAWFAPSHSPADRPIYTAPTTEVPLPSCVTEDGAGQALCMWDAQSQGNGQGTSIISGDCAPAYVGSQQASDVCVRLHSLPSTHTVNEDGSEVTMPNGADLVAECNEENTRMTIAEKNANEFDVIDCFNAQMNS
jgi:hypothetical protein